MAIVAPFLPYEHLRIVAEDFLSENHPSGELPIPIERIGDTIAGQNLRRYFPMMAVNASGLCEQCAAAVSASRQDVR